MRGKRGYHDTWSSKDYSRWRRFPPTVYNSTSVALSFFPHLLEHTGSEHSVSFQPELHQHSKEQFALRAHATAHAAAVAVITTNIVTGTKAAHTANDRHR